MQNDFFGLGSSGDLMHVRQSFYYWAMSLNYIQNTFYNKDTKLQPEESQLWETPQALLIKKV